MANTYSQVLLQIVFAVKGRQNLIFETNRQRIEKYICGIIEHNNCKPLAIYCNPDHCHILIGFSLTTSISDLVRDIKSNSSRFINQNRLIMGKFEWQEGYGVFSYSKSQLNSVTKYILNQQNHHQRKSFNEEYIEFLDRFEIAFDSKYIFEFYD
ncbi:MAG: putative transposase [Bacteroidetes bacterium]|nr:putative transposase [Bacteroidota bacterium]